MAHIATAGVSLVNLTSGNVINFAPGKASVSVVTGVVNQALVDLSGGPATIGPFNVDVTLKITVSTGTVMYSGPVVTDAFDNLIDFDGSVIPIGDGEGVPGAPGEPGEDAPPRANTFSPQQYNILAGLSAGVNDDTAALTSAWNAALAVGGTVDLSSGTYRITAPLPEITSRMCVRGDGEYQCRIYYDKAAIGTCLRINGTWIGSDASNLESSTYRPVDGQRSGVRLANFSIWGDRTTVATQDGIVAIGRCDNLAFEHVSVQFMKGWGIALGVPTTGVGAANSVGYVRESSFRSIQVRWCGDVTTGRSAFLLNSDGYRGPGDGTGANDDASNNLWFSDFKSIYSNGCGFEIRGGNTGFSPNQIRYITFHGCFLENDDSLSSTVHGAKIHGRVENLDMIAEIQGSHTDNGSYCLMITDLAGQKPNNSRFNLTWGGVARAVKVNACSNIELLLGSVAATVVDVRVENCVRPVTIKGVGEEATGATQGIFTADAGSLAWMRVVPPREVYTLATRPAASTYVNSSIVVTDGGGGGGPVWQYSNGSAWTSVGT